MRVYPGPTARLALEAARWAFRMRPRAPRIDSQRIELRSLDGTGVMAQADGDVIGARATWTFEIRPAAVRLIGRWS
jgi:hypothetical protein